MATLVFVTCSRN